MTIRSRHVMLMDVVRALTVASAQPHGVRRMYSSTAAPLSVSMTRDAIRAVAVETAGKLLREHRGYSLMAAPPFAAEIGPFTVAAAEHWSEEVPMLMLAITWGHLTARSSGYPT